MSRSASRRPTGIEMDSGDDVSHTVDDGQALPFSSAGTYAMRLQYAATERDGLKCAAKQGDAPRKRSQ